MGLLSAVGGVGGRVSAMGTKEEILPELLHASAGCRYTANTTNC